MKVQNKKLDDFFHTASKLTIVVPIAVILLAIFLKFGRGAPQEKSFLKYSLTPTPTKAKNLFESINRLKQSTSSAKFNLTGPLSCSISADTATMSAYVKDKKIRLSIEEKNNFQNYLLREDCVYIWKSGSYSGEKICGLSQQIGLIESLLSSNLIDPTVIFENLNQVMAVSPTGISSLGLESVLNSCSSRAIQNLTVFDIPKNILFKNKK